MNRRIALALAFAATGLALAGCPRDDAQRNAAPATLPIDPTTPASIATPSPAPPASSAADSAQPAQSGHSRAPAPEPEPATPPPPVDK